MGLGQRSSETADQAPLVCPCLPSRARPAKRLNQRVPDDVLIYGLLTDAHIELGHYQEAEGAAQWMLDLRPGNIPALTRTAYLRELFGDLEGAREVMEDAYRRTPPQEVEDRAWLLTQLAHLQLMAGQVEAAEPLLLQALVIFPHYHYALAQLAKVRTAQQRFEEAAELLHERFLAAPHPENLFALAEALERAGRLEEAGLAFTVFEEQGLRESAGADNANRELIFYYTDHAGKRIEALRIAGTEIEKRQDVYTRDAYAWALFANGQYALARKQMDVVLSVGVRDAMLFYHAGLMAWKLNDQPAALHYLQESLTANSRSESASAVRAALKRLTTSSAVLQAVRQPQVSEPAELDSA